MDRVFKIILLALLAGFLVVYAWRSNNGRYAFTEKGVLDTRTGIVYLVRSTCDFQAPGCMELYSGQK
jgi:hypothetical protein